MIAAAGLSSGHVDLADWLFLAAFVVFVVDVLLVFLAARADAGAVRLRLVSVGFALLALAWFVL